MMKMMLIFLLWLCCGPAQSSVIQRYKDYHYSPRTWQDARAHCHSYGWELLTIVTQSEIEKENMDAYYAWIGLKEYILVWCWSDGSRCYMADNDTFVENEPQPTDDCALTRYTYTKAVGDLCENRHFFFCHYSDDGQRRFRFIPETKSWDQAFKSCQNSSQVLAIFNNWTNWPSDEKRDFPVWTGLYHDGESWKWSDGEHSDYWNCSSPGTGLCGSVWSQNKSMSVQNCSEAFPFLCYTHNLVLVQQNRTWEQAVDHCRSLQAVSPYRPHHLLSVEQQELVYAHSKAIDAQTNKVWLGLRFLGGSWFWSNGEVVSLTGLPSCPESRLGCGALVLDRTLNGSETEPTIELSDCSERLNLLCYRL